MPGLVQTHRCSHGLTLEGYEQHVWRVQGRVVLSGQPCLCGCAAFWGPDQWDVRAPWVAGAAMVGAIAVEPWCANLPRDPESLSETGR